MTSVRNRYSMALNKAPRLIFDNQKHVEPDAKELLGRLLPIEAKKQKGPLYYPPKPREKPKFKKERKDRWDELEDIPEYMSDPADEYETIIATKPRNEEHRKAMERVLPKVTKEQQEEYLLKIYQAPEVYPYGYTLPTEPTKED